MWSSPETASVQRVGHCISNTQFPTTCITLAFRQYCTAYIHMLFIYTGISCIDLHIYQKSSGGVINIPSSINAVTLTWGSLQVSCASNIHKIVFPSRIDPVVRSVNQPVASVASINLSIDPLLHWHVDEVKLRARYFWGYLLFGLRQSIVYLVAVAFTWEHRLKVLVCNGDGCLGRRVRLAWFSK